MSKKWQTGIAIFLLFLAFIVTGSLAYRSGYNLGWEDGHRVAEVETPKYVPAVTWTHSRAWSEVDEPDWENTLSSILEQIDTANITIHIEDTEGVKADIHISWSK